MKVSVIIPTHNRPSYLAQAVHSVLNQDYPAAEIIIVDDGSLPRYQPAIEVIKNLDACIKGFRFSENRGVSAARNFGLEKARGDFILFLDDDDLLDPAMIHSCTKIFESHDVDIVACSYGIFFDDAKPDFVDNYLERPKTLLPNKILYTQSYEVYPSIEEVPLSSLLRVSLQLSSCLIRKNAFGEVRFQEKLVRGEDIYFWLCLAAANNRFKRSTKQLSYYRLHANNSLRKTEAEWAFVTFLEQLLQSNMLQGRLDYFIMHYGLAKRLILLKNKKGLIHILRMFGYLLHPKTIFLLPDLLSFFIDKLKRRINYKEIREIEKAIANQV